MTKDELKVGYLVQCNNGHYYEVVPTAKGIVLVREGGFYALLCEYDNDLHNVAANGSTLNITKVYGHMNSVSRLEERYNPNYRDLLWDREVKIITCEEIKRILNCKKFIIKDYDLAEE